MEIGNSWISCCQQCTIQSMKWWWCFADARFCYRCILKCLNKSADTKTVSLMTAFMVWIKVSEFDVVCMLNSIDKMQGIHTWNAYSPTDLNRHAPSSPMRFMMKPRFSFSVCSNQCSFCQHKKVPAELNHDIRKLPLNEIPTPNRKLQHGPSARRNSSATLVQYWPDVLPTPSINTMSQQGLNQVCHITAVAWPWFSIGSLSEWHRYMGVWDVLQTERMFSSKITFPGKTRD